MFKIRYNYPISNVTYIKVGGKVKLYIETDELDIIKKILTVNKKIKYIGNASNIFFSFDYSDYIFIKYINKKIIINEYLELGSSVSIKYLSNKLTKEGIKGFEKLNGIPGLIGGSIVNNCSCFNQCISDNLCQLNILDNLGDEKILNKEDINFSYHYSSLRNKNYLIINARFNKILCSKDELEKDYLKSLKYRQMYQPISKLTLGSTFKKMENIIIPQIIENLGLKGKTKGKSKISQVHSNFIEIETNEKFRNIITLIEETNRILYNKLGYYIELEIELLRGNK